MTSRSLIAHRSVRRWFLIAAGFSASTLIGWVMAQGHTFDFETNRASPSPIGQADLRDRVLINPTAYIPTQCYTRTEDKRQRIHNPCFSCHTEPRRPNFVNDSDLQLAFAFPLPAQTNPWKNLFKDRRKAIASISDTDILKYIRTSNYFSVDGRILPQQRLAEVPPGWDFDRNGRWDGFVPDSYFRFDEDGFDHDPDGRPTGWRAFAYYPFLGTFWPTNGSTDDVLIRLPPPFRTNLRGQFDLSVYKTNLAIVEAVLKEQDVPIDPVDEAALGSIDLDKNGTIGIATRVAYDWAPLQRRFMWYVGQALEDQRTGKVHLAAGLYPEGTEFLHTVRYIDLGPKGENRLSARMKEVRYARKNYWASYAQLQSQALGELKEKHDFPDRPRTVRGNVEAGVSNDKGWIYAAMIEDAQGHLRPQSYEELAFCVGCHGGIGANRDGVFSFHRKFDHADVRAKGWYHWSQQGLEGVPDRLRADGRPEYTFYLETNGAGDEFRGNREILRKFFDRDGELRPEAVNALGQDVSILLAASPARALQLNKAYREIVREQSFVQGRDASWIPVTNVYEEVEEGKPTGVELPAKGY
jgi:hypothetical protein